jgi:hypothetical protein
LAYNRGKCCGAVLACRNNEIIHAVRCLNAKNTIFWVCGWLDGYKQKYSFGEVGNSFNYGIGLVFKTVSKLVEQARFG